MSDSADDAGDEIRQAARAALEDVNALEASGDDRRIILKAVLQARLSMHAPAAVSAASLHAPAARDRMTGPPAVAGEADVLDKMSSVFGLDRETLELVYDVQDGEPALVISSKKVASGKAEGARQLTQLVAAARQIAGIEEWTSANVLRPIVQDYGRLDSANFASAIQQLDTVAVLRGRGQGRELKITRSGLEKVAELIKSLTSGDS
ncbi:hypothetical protein ACFWUU_13515 [Kribbella sp. NPDC058693]|uniref:hypothetical protein n=1 Tax=Kribbella sp. NPDC058693 TaxID=3346602 RepID=UPI00364E39C5